MKREITNKHVSCITTIWPLFYWYRCINCGKEFRREKGFGANIGSVFTYRYVCASCAPNKTKAYELLLAYKRDGYWNEIL